MHWNDALRTQFVEKRGVGRRKGVGLRVVKEIGCSYCLSIPTSRERGEGEKLCNSSRPFNVFAWLTGRCKAVSSYPRVKKIEEGEKNMGDSQGEMSRNSGKGGEG